MGLKNLLEKKLNKKELEYLKTSFDVIGDVAVIEIPDELKKKEKDIARALVKVHPHIKTVLKKSSNRFGEYRLRKMTTIIGRKTETDVKEHGCVFRLDVKKAYFSPRESTERQKVASDVKPKETILVMFSGVAPFAVAIAKKQPKVDKIYAVEINPDAHKYVLNNARINKVGGKVFPICGDVRKECVRFYGKCNRIIMPLPKEGHQFLPTAIKCLKRNGTIYFYYVGMKDNMFQNAIDIVKMECNKIGKKAQIVKQRKVLPYGPGTYKICIEFKVR